MSEVVRVVRFAWRMKRAASLEEQELGSNGVCVDAAGTHLDYLLYPILNITRERRRYSVWQIRYVQRLCDILYAV